MNYKNNYPDKDLEWKQEHRYSFDNSGREIITKHQQINIILEDSEKHTTSLSSIKIQLYSNKNHIATMQSSHAKLSYNKEQKRTSMRIPFKIDLFHPETTYTFYGEFHNENIQANDSLSSILRSDSYANQQLKLVLTPNRELRIFKKENEYWKPI